MTSTLAEARCIHHRDREAAARCTECRHDFCRECVVEHEGRLVCSACLAALVAPRRRRRRGMLGRAARLAVAVLGFMLAWAVFFALGDGLARLPDPTHRDSGGHSR